MLLTALNSLISGVAYHLGGLGEDGEKAYPSIPSWLFNSKVRDWGCALCNVVALNTVAGLLEWWKDVLIFGLSWLFLSMYHKWLNSLTNKPTNVVYWFNWAVHSFCMSLPSFFLIDRIHWWIIALYCIAVTVINTVWSELISLAWLEEGGRGFFYIFLTTILKIRL